MNRLMLLVGSGILVGLVGVGLSLTHHQAPTPPVSVPGGSDAIALPSGETSVGRIRPVVPGASSQGGTLTWHVLSSHTAHRIRNQYFDSIASGIYVIEEIAATNGTSQSIALVAGQIALEAGGRRYAPDPKSVAGLELEGHRGLSVGDLGPAATTTGWIAFDVPPSAIRSGSQVCFGNDHRPSMGCITTG